MKFRYQILFILLNVIGCNSCAEIVCTQIARAQTNQVRAHPADQVNSSIKNLVWEEIKLYKEDPEVSQQLKIKDSFIKNMAGLIDTVKIANNKGGFADQALSHFFLNIFPGGILRFGSEDGLIMLPEDKTPQLHEMVKDLCQKMKIPMPVVFLSGDKKLFNAYATSLSPGLSMVVLGQRLLKKLTYNELKMVLAHELGHVKQSHIPQQIGLSLLGSLIIPATLLYLIQGLDDGTRTVGAPTAFISSLKSLPASLLIWTGMSVITAVCLLLRGRAMEKEADMIALETVADSEAFVSMIEKIEDKVLHDKKSFEESYLYVTNKLTELSAESPKSAWLLQRLLNGHYKTRSQVFNSTLEEDNGDHPSCKTRKEYGKAFNGGFNASQDSGQDLSEQELIAQEAPNQAPVFVDQMS